MAGSERRRARGALPRFPSLYQVNTRVWLTRLAGHLGRPVTLGDVPDDDLDRMAALGFDWVYLLGVWRTGAAGRRISRSHPGWRREFEQTLDDLVAEDICGSCFAVTGYAVPDALGGDAALRHLRGRLADRGLRLMLDFVPNHTAPDHPWVAQHPDFYRRGTPEDLARDPGRHVRVGEQVYAYGRDPYFPGWPDTLQLDYANPAVQSAMRAELRSVAERCDGVRCDMAMLLLPEVFTQTWGETPPPFWPEAIAAVRRAQPDFTFLAEVYWDLEWTLQQQGFDVTYDKGLYDRLREGGAAGVREHLRADPGYQARMARFLENHDEPRAAATFAADVLPAAALITYTTPGLRFLHAGQLEGWTRHIPPHLCRGPDEATDGRLAGFHQRLLAILRRPALREGRWRLLECLPVTEHEPGEDFLAWSWDAAGTGDHSLVVVVNYGPEAGRCHVRVPDGMPEAVALSELPGDTVGLTDLLDGGQYRVGARDLRDHGLYVERPGWGAHVLALGPPSG